MCGSQVCQVWPACNALPINSGIGEVHILQAGQALNLTSLASSNCYWEGVQQGGLAAWHQALVHASARFKPDKHRFRATTLSSRCQGAAGVVVAGHRASDCPFTAVCELPT